MLNDYLATYGGEAPPPDEKRQKKEYNEKPRQYAGLWQVCLNYDEFMKMGQKHKNRLSAINRGKSQMMAELEEKLIAVMEANKAEQERAIDGMLSIAPISEWVLSHKGIGPVFAGKLISIIDDPAYFDTVSKLWRFSGLAVIDGRAESKSSVHYSRRMKGTLWNIGDQFIRHRNEDYRPIYDLEKERQRSLYPHKLCRTCSIAQKVDVLKSDCRKKGHVSVYSDQHLHLRAWRKMMKFFLRDLWVTWRIMDDLPVEHDPEYRKAVGLPAQ